MATPPRTHTTRTGHTVTVTPPSPPAPAPLLPVLPAIDVLTNPEAGKPPGHLEPDSINPLGITSGQGNNGSNNTAHLAGHAGTAADPHSIPRQLKGGSGSGINGRVY